MSNFERKRRAGSVANSRVARAIFILSAFSLGFFIIFSYWGMANILRVFAFNSVPSEKSTLIAKEVNLALSLRNNPTSEFPIPVVAVFSEAVTGFEISDIGITGSAAIGTLIVNDPGIQYTINLIPISDGEITVNIDADIANAADPPHSGNTAAELIVVYDSTPPRPKLSSTESNPTSSSPIPMKVEFMNGLSEEKEKVYGFESNDINVQNGTVEDFSGEDGDKSYTFDIVPETKGMIQVDIPAAKARDAAGNESFRAESFTIEYNGSSEDKEIFLPLVTRPFTGPIAFGSERMAGLTSFVPDITLDFSQMGFGDNQPDKVKVWPANSAEPGEDAWQDYKESDFPYLLNPAIVGVQSLVARFQTEGASSVPAKTTIFYLPNGDFNENKEYQWIFADAPLPVELINGKLRLGYTHSEVDCDSVPLGRAIAELKVQIPENSIYELFVEGMVYTYDKLPDPNEAKFDAFEVHINDETTTTVRRYGNSKAPLNCQTARKVPVSDNIPLNLYSGTVSFTLENWSRFDNYYNTYTEVDKIWIDK